MKAPIADRRRQSPRNDVVDDAPPEEDVFAEMTLQEHLEELRKRIIRSSLAILVGVVVGIFTAFRVISAVADQAGVDTKTLQIISPTEPFTVYFKVVLYIAIAFAMPVLVYQLLQFVSPGLTRRERRAVIAAVPFVMVMFVLGVLFAFFVLAPRALEFLSTFGSSYFEWNPRAEEVISFYMRLMIGVGIVFELPVVMFALARIGAVTYKQFARVRKFAFLLGMVAAAIITPTPDPFNMMLVGIPIYALYEIGILMARLARPLKPDRARSE
ncbi:MAG TPA: twin-arginine translocase subunit TatC [Thermomicrobiales bacterium]|nr:twin-arginine translocase subunit TatC [Thermomicrobiales bacterium]